MTRSVLSFLLSRGNAAVDCHFINCTCTSAYDRRLCLSLTFLFIAPLVVGDALLLHTFTLFDTYVWVCWCCQLYLDIYCMYRLQEETPKEEDDEEKIEEVKDEEETKEKKKKTVVPASQPDC